MSLLSVCNKKNVCMKEGNLPCHPRMHRTTNQDQKRSSFRTRSWASVLELKHGPQDIR